MVTNLLIYFKEVNLSKVIKKTSMIKAYFFSEKVKAY